jgi:hypothetical protein
MVWSKASIKPVRQFLPNRLALIGFVFSCPTGWYIAINPFHIILYADLPILKLALFFQTAPQRIPGVALIFPFAFLLLPFLKLALFFQIVLTAEFAENAGETKSPNQLHQS